VGLRNLKFICEKWKTADDKKSFSDLISLMNKFMVI